MTCEVRSKMSEFDDRTFHFYAQPDGTIGWPNSAEGDLLKIARKEIDELRELLLEVGGAVTARRGPGPWSDEGTYMWVKDGDEFGWVERRDKLLNINQNEGIYI
jgi:hypothetical protein